MIFKRAFHKLKVLPHLYPPLTGHNKLKRHKNIQDRVENIYSCRLCEEDEESSFHVIAECPAMQLHRTRPFEIQGNKKLPNPPDWTVTQVVKFLKISPLGEMLENQDWMS